MGVKKLAWIRRRCTIIIPVLAPSSQVAVADGFSHKPAILLIVVLLAVVGNGWNFFS